MTLSEPAHLEADGYLIRALRRLGEGLGPYVYEKTGFDGLIRNGSVTLDVQPILHTMVASGNWDRHFRELGRDGRNWVSELIEFRNGPWAHLVGYSDDDVLHYLGVITRLLRTVSAAEQAEAVERMWSELGKLIFGESEPVRQLDTENTELRRRVFELEREKSDLQNRYSHVSGQLQGFYYAGSKMALPPPDTIAAVPPMISETDDSGLPDDAPPTEVDFLSDSREQGVEAYEAGDMEGAIASYSDALKLNPSDWRTHLLLGIACAQNGEYGRAMASYNSALEMDPDNSDAYVLRAMAHQERGEHHVAIDDFNDGLRLNPAEVEAYHNRGVSYAAIGEHDLAIADFDTVLNLSPEHEFAYNNRGNSYGAKGEYDRAIADHSEAISISPGYASAYYNRGYAHGAKGDYDKAISDFGEALRLNPDDAASHNHRGVAYGNLKQYGLAIADHNEAIRLDPGYGPAYHGRDLPMVRWENTTGRLPTLGRRCGLIQKTRPATSTEASLTLRKRTTNEPYPISTWS